MRASPFDVKRKTGRQSESVEPSGRRIATRKGRPNITPEEDPNAKDLEAVENAIKETMGETNTTSDESHDAVQKRKRKLDALCEWLVLPRAFPVLIQSFTAVPATPPPKRANFGQGRMGFVGGGGAGPNEVFVQGDVSVCYQRS